MIRLILIALFFQLPPAPTLVPLASPTPLPTSEPVDLQATLAMPAQNEVYDYLATANANVESVPQDLSAPGVAILPQEDGREVFGYAKWVISGTAANEVFGPFGVLVSHVTAIVTLVIFLAIVYVIIFLVSLILRFVAWIIRKIRTVGA